MDASIKGHLVSLLEEGDTVISFGSADNIAGEPRFHIMWRASMIDRTWMQGYGVTLVDFSSELFGLSTLFLPPRFFETYSVAPTV